MIIFTFPAVSNKIITVDTNVSTDVHESDYTNNNDSATVEVLPYESNLTNNHDSSKVEILPLCDLAICIVCDKGSVNLTGDSDSNLNWNITVLNNGLDGASNVCVNLSDLESLSLIVLNSSNDA